MTNIKSFIKETNNLKKSNSCFLSFEKIRKETKRKKEKRKEEKNSVKKTKLSI